MEGVNEPVYIAGVLLGPQNDATGLRGQDSIGLLILMSFGGAYRIDEAMNMPMKRGGGWIHEGLWESKCGFFNLAGAWKGAFWSWGYLKSLHNWELRSYPQISKHILVSESGITQIESYSKEGRLEPEKPYLIGGLDSYCRVY